MSRTIADQPQAPREGRGLSCCTFVAQMGSAPPAPSPISNFIETLKPTFRPRALPGSMLKDNLYRCTQKTGVRTLTAEILRIHPDEPEPALVSIVAASLNAGNVVALPTDTFYGLAVDPINLRAVDRIYEIKTRARHKPLSLLICEVEQAYELAREIDTAFDRLAEKFWPGPLTIIVKAGSKLPLRVTANTGNVALRVPEAAISRAVVAKLGLPITATSANLSGHAECTYANCVMNQLGDQVPLIVDGGPTARSTATTIVDLSGGGSSWMIVREGAIATHEIALTLQR